MDKAMKNIDTITEALSLFEYPIDRENELSIGEWLPDDIPTIPVNINENWSKAWQAKNAPAHRFITVVQENQYTANEWNSTHSKSQIKCTNGWKPNQTEWVKPLGH